jgi:hypothetical protein
MLCQKTKTVLDNPPVTAAFGHPLPIGWEEGRGEGLPVCSSALN